MKSVLVVALFTLAACTDRGVQPKRRVLTDSADQVTTSLATTLVRNGVRSSDVIADSAWLYQGRQVYDLKRMTVKMFDTTGAVISTIIADKGIYSMREQSLDARGHVIATSSGGRVLKTEHLIYDKRRNLVTSDTAFTMTSPQLNMSGAHFESDPGFKNVTVTKIKAIQKGGKAAPVRRPAGGTK